MSNKAGRKSHTATLAEEKEKRTDSPVKEMKKKIAANAEKEKQATDKTEKTVTPPEKADKITEKPQNEKTDNKKAQNTEKIDKSTTTPDKNAQKPDKNAQKPDKNAQKQDNIAEKTDKSTEKEKPAEKSDKKTEKVADKKADKPAEKKNEPEKKEETNGDGKVIHVPLSASLKEGTLQGKPERPKQNGAANGDANGVDTVSERDSSEEELVIDEQDEMFPELTYDDTSEGEEDAPSRSLTRRSQVKSTITPETPRPASYKEDDSKEKVLKMNDSLATDRKLRSADSPKREPKKQEAKKAQDSPKKDKIVDLTEEETKSEEIAEKSSGKSQLEMDAVVEVESMEETVEARGRTRARVSPYTRPRHDQTTSSVTANYTGNNTTMEMDITESSSVLEESSLDDSGYLRGLRAIRGRASYRPLRELSRHGLVRAPVPLSESGRPTGTVVGRKRKPDEDESRPEPPGPEPELAAEAGEEPAGYTLHAHHKRMRLFDRFSVPFRGFNTRPAEIVGINTDLPLTAPVASPPIFDPETLKAAPSEPIAVPLPTPTQYTDNKRCVVM